MTALRIRVSETYSAFGDQIAALPRILDRVGVTLHSGRNLIKRLNIASTDGESLTVAVKAFAVPARPRGLVYAHLRRSKARRCMSNANILVAKGIETPDPMASIEQHEFACLRSSYYVSRYWHHDVDLTALLYRGASYGYERDTLLEQLAQFTAAQHDLGVQHLDYNPGNILVRTSDVGYLFSLVDLNRLRFRQFGIDDRIAGLVRLANRFDHLQTIGRHYAVCCGFDPDDFCRRLQSARVRFVTRRRRIKKVKAMLR